MSRLFMSGTPPIHIESLAQDLQIPKDELRIILSDLEKKGDIQVIDGLVMLKNRNNDE